ncbi:MAG: MerR family transcriptional regulator [Sphaerochaetaceae bacterium]|nr:MerR family transcriptional regulator [Sphaerochaetaceae bacterium]MDC7249582.1 MerR family transcriptional regulator [Sphaerochaetaceae bacterium]
MKKEYTVGELASLFKINNQTLYYYDKIGLFSPDKRTSSSNIRKYSFEQIYELSTILYLKRLGLSLTEIKESLLNLTPETANSILTEKSVELRKNLSEIIRIDDAISRKLKYINKEKKNQEKDSDKVIYRKKRYYYNMGDETLLYSDDSFYFYPTVAIYTSTGKSFGALLENHEKDFLDPNNITTIPRGDYLIAYHIGPYETIPKHREEIMNQRKDLKFSEYMFNFNIYDQFNVSDSNNYLTRMEFLLEK